MYISNLIQIANLAIVFTYTFMLLGTLTTQLDRYVVKNNEARLIVYDDASKYVVMKVRNGEINTDSYEIILPGEIGEIRRGKAIELFK